MTEDRRRFASAAEEYNGWSNYETWLVKLWIDNDQGSYIDWQQHMRAIERETHKSGSRSEYWTEEQSILYTLEERLKAHFEETNPLADSASFWADLLNASLSRVDWREIAEALIEDAKEIAE